MRTLYCCLVSLICIVSHVSGKNPVIAGVVTTDSNYVVPNVQLCLIVNEMVVESVLTDKNGWFVFEGMEGEPDKCSIVVLNENGSINTEKVYSPDEYRKLITLVCNSNIFVK